MATKFGFTITTSSRLFHAPFRKKPIFSPNSVSPLINFGGRKLSIRRRLLFLSPKATTDQPGQVKEDEIEDSKILQYCSIDGKGKKSLGEMEQEFLQALQSFYYEGKAMMSNEEFDNLKEELMWEGSSVVMLSPDEQRFLEASMAYVSGNPIMTDEEYDKLKMKLKLPEPFSFIFTWFAALPLILWLSFTITNAIVKDFLILKGPCPNCGTENTSFFGTILSVSNGGSSNKVKCSCCGTDLVYDSDTRLITLPEGSSA
uniref:PGR5 1A, chloroplastic n=1 Tax=Solanum tuberosum TaxID=4113 RepID=M1AXK4_SOLTU